MGVALSASVNVSDRPMTGQGVMGMKTQMKGQGRLVEDSSYFVGLLRQKIKDVNGETIRLRQEIDQQSKDSSTFVHLERRYDTLLKTKENLEGQLADYNLAMDKMRTSTDPEDVNQVIMQIAEKNRQSATELDRVFMLRKQRENETTQIEQQIEQHYQAIQNRINELEPGKLRVYEELMARQRDMQERAISAESRLNDVNARIRHLETDEKNNSLRKEYATLEKNVNYLRKDSQSLQEELDIANMDPKEAHASFLGRVNQYKASTKAAEERLVSLRDECDRLRRSIEVADAPAEQDNGDAAKYELLQKRDQDMTAFIDKFDESRESIISEQRTAKETIVVLLEHIGRSIDETSNMPTQDALGEMKDARSFKEKNLATAEKTMESLKGEHRKRQKELELLRNSEPKLEKELTGLTEAMTKMRSEMGQFQDMEGLRHNFDRTQEKLQDLRRAYMKRRDAMRQQVQALSAEHEHLKRNLNSHDTARDLDDMEKRLKHYERSIFELREFIENKSRETDYEVIKGSCLGITDKLNADCIKTSQEPVGAKYAPY